MIRSANVDDIPDLVFPITEPVAFKDVLQGDRALGYCSAFRVNEAGTVTVTCKSPRNDHANEDIPCLAGETIYGKFTAIVDADSGCYPIVVSS